MFKLLSRGVAAVVVSSCMLAAGESRACCFSCLFHHCARPAPAPCTYAPAAPACDVCPQQVNYVPQTCFRTEYACTPCTTFRPVTTCDPCNPCAGPQTVMQPVTTFVRRPVMVPFTTYRPVVSQVNYAAPACSTCGGAAYYSPSYGGATFGAAPAYAPGAMAAPTPGCPNCGGGASISYGAAPATYTTPAYGAPVMSTPGAPALAPAQGTPAPAANGAPQTFQSTPPAGTSSSMYPPIQPVPDADKLNPGNAPRLMPPENRTTSHTLMGPANVTQAIFRTADRATVFQPATFNSNNAQRIDTPSDGWSASTSPNDGWQSGR